MNMRYKKLILLLSFAFLLSCENKGPSNKVDCSLGRQYNISNSDLPKVNEKTLSNTNFRGMVLGGPTLTINTLENKKINSIRFEGGPYSVLDTPLIKEKISYMDNTSYIRKSPKGIASEFYGDRHDSLAFQKLITAKINPEKTCPQIENQNGQPNQIFGIYKNQILQNTFTVICYPETPEEKKYIVNMEASDMEMAAFSILFDKSLQEAEYLVSCALKNNQPLDEKVRY